MKTVTRCKRNARLSTIIDRPGGISVGVALKQASENLAPMKAKGLVIVSGLVTELEALPAPATPGQTEARLEQTYRIGLAILDAIGPFDLPYLQRAAWGLCDLSDRFVAGRPFDWRVVQVHTQALRLFLSSGPDTPAVAFDKVIEGLDKTVAHQRAG